MAQAMGSSLQRIRQHWPLLTPLRIPEMRQGPNGFLLPRFFGQCAVLDEADESTMKAELDSSSSSVEEVSKDPISSASKDDKITSMVDLLLQHNKGHIKNAKNGEKSKTEAKVSGTGDTMKPTKSGMKSGALQKDNSSRLEKLLGSLTGGKKNEGEGEKERKPIGIDAILSGIGKAKDLKQVKNQPNSIESILNSPPPKAKSLAKDSEDEFSDLDEPPETDLLNKSKNVQRFAKTQEQNSIPQSLKSGGLARGMPKTAQGVRNITGYDNRGTVSRPRIMSSEFAKDKAADSVSESNNRSSVELRKEKPAFALACRDDSALLTVAVENIPEGLSISRVKEALSHHGEITGCLKMPSRSKNGSVFCHIEFQTQEAKEKALADRWVYVDGQRFRLQRVDHPKTTVVRVMNVSPTTTEDKVLLTCNKCGHVDAITKRDEGIYDVYFSLKEKPNMLNILDGLNEVTLHQSSWRAQPAPLVHLNAKEALLKTEEGRVWHRSQKKQSLEMMEKSVQSLLIGIQDLQQLFLLEERASTHIAGSEDGNSRKPEDVCLDKLLRSVSK